MKSMQMNLTRKFSIYWKIQSNWFHKFPFWLRLCWWQHECCYRATSVNNIGLGLSFSELLSPWKPFWNHKKTHNPMNVRDRQTENSFKITILPPLKKPQRDPVAFSNPFGNKIKPNLSDHSKITTGRVQNKNIVDFTNIGIIIGLFLLMALLRLLRHQFVKIKSKIIIQMSSIKSIWLKRFLLVDAFFKTSTEFYTWMRVTQICAR